MTIRTSSFHRSVGIPPIQWIISKKKSVPGEKNGQVPIKKKYIPTGNK